MHRRLLFSELSGGHDVQHLQSLYYNSDIGRFISEDNPTSNQQDSISSKFVHCANTMVRWSKGILNSFDCPYTNGFTEGANNKIKILKRNAYGYRNFSRFRNRILQCSVLQRKKERLDSAHSHFHFWVTPTIDIEPKKASIRLEYWLFCGAGDTAPANPKLFTTGKCFGIAFEIK